jgi:uncharacterized protein
MAITLRAFIEDSRRPAGTLRYHELQGFLFAVASSPELVKPSEWMPMVFGGAEPEYGSIDEARAVLGELMALYNTINSTIFTGRVALPADCTFRTELLANLDDASPVSQWSRGFLQGHQWLEDVWNAYVPSELDDELAAMLMTLSFFASKEIAEAFCAETEGKNLAELAATIKRVFPTAAEEYAHLGRTIHQVVAESETAAQSRDAKIGRNEPCPCGSGRKYKRCCGAAQR